METEAVAAGVMVLVVGAGVATALTGSWLPALGTAGELFLFDQFMRWRSGRKRVGGCRLCCRVINQVGFEPGGW